MFRDIVHFRKNPRLALLLENTGEKNNGKYSV